MDVFNLRDSVIGDHGRYVRSFLSIKVERIRRLVHEEMDHGFLWPDPLIQLNPSFETGESYQPLLDPPPTDPRMAHPESTRPRGGSSGEPQA